VEGVAEGGRGGGVDGWGKVKMVRPLWESKFHELSYSLRPSKRPSTGCCSLKYAVLSLYAILIKREARTVHDGLV
jgi:hypothetical protein